MKTVRKLSRNEVAARRVEQCITARKVLCAHNALDHEDTTVGPYTEAVDRGARFACLGVKGRTTGQERFTRALDAAWAFVDRVGSTRANEVAKAAAKKAGIALTV